MLCPSLGQIRVRISELPILIVGFHQKFHSAMVGTTGFWGANFGFESPSLPRNFNFASLRIVLKLKLSFSSAGTWKTHCWIPFVLKYRLFFNNLQELLPNYFLFFKVSLLVLKCPNLTLLKLSKKIHPPKTTSSLYKLFSTLKFGLFLLKNSFHYLYYVFFSVIKFFKPKNKKRIR